MFKLTHIYAVVWPAFKRIYIRCTQKSLGLVNDEIEQLYFVIATEDSATSVKVLHHKQELLVKQKAASIALYSDGDQLGVLYLAPISLLSKNRLASRSWENNEIIGTSHFARLMCIMKKLIKKVMNCQLISFKKLNVLNGS